ncbi:predicted protein [Nematostella vectensis]|uniref:Uncharacterized protein n=1 Tax=Nematostella vectensis TaxID=45351 RepID=A7S8I0_NEMVE|nr:predicted protein [Nematostella vectensis]|eukprot:XP_001632053.1 predicted protein [Nematostella vectensis]
MARLRLQLVLLLSVVMYGVYGRPMHNPVEPDSYSYLHAKLQNASQQSTGKAMISILRTCARLRSGICAPFSTPSGPTPTEESTPPSDTWLTDLIITALSKENREEMVATLRSSARLRKRVCEVSETDQAAHGNENREHVETNAIESSYSDEFVSFLQSRKRRSTVEEALEKLPQLDDSDSLDAAPGVGAREEYVEMHEPTERKAPGVVLRDAEESDKSRGSDEKESGVVARDESETRDDPSQPADGEFAIATPIPPLLTSTSGIEKPFPMTATANTLLRLDGTFDESLLIQPESLAESSESSPKRRRRGVSNLDIENEQVTSSSEKRLHPGIKKRVHPGHVEPGVENRPSRNNVEKRVEIPDKEIELALKYEEDDEKRSNEGGELNKQMSSAPKKRGKLQTTLKKKEKMEPKDVEESLHEQEKSDASKRGKLGASLKNKVPEVVVRGEETRDGLESRDLGSEQKPRDRVLLDIDEMPSDK